jgi:hypothetical protein
MGLITWFTVKAVVRAIKRKHEPYDNGFNLPLTWMAHVKGHPYSRFPVQGTQCRPVSGVKDNSWPFLLSSPLMMQKTPPLNFWWIFCSLHPSKLNSIGFNNDLQHSLGAQILEAPVQPQPWEAKAGTRSADLHARLHYTTLSTGLSRHAPATVGSRAWMNTLTNTLECVASLATRELQSLTGCRCPWDNLGV